MPGAADEVVALFDEFQAPVMRYVLCSGIVAEDAEELVQEVFLLLFQRLRTGGTREKIAREHAPGWIFRTARNLVLKQRDRARREAGVRGELPCMESAADSADRVDAVLAHREEQQSLMAVVRALPEQDQQCLHLRAEGLRYREIAGVLGISLGSVANSLQGSIRKIARANERGR